MRKIVFLVAFISVLACKEHVKIEAKEELQIKQITTVKEFPKELMKIFDAHGGLNSWKSQRTLRYNLPKPDAIETHVIDLISRKDKITTSNFSMGFDGNDVWLLDANEDYQGDPIFYHNLMFYFYAMPFVFADDGIQYDTTTNLEYKGVSYPGIQISYDNGVGTSPKDDYYIHYHPETYQMQWLGYTVTYKSGEASNNVKWIRYNEWEDVNGIILPKAITWHNYEGKEIKEERSTVAFENRTLSKERMASNFFQKPNGATIALKK